MSNGQVWTWKELKKFYRKHRYSNFALADYLDRVPHEWRLGIALALSVIKWEPRKPCQGIGTCALCTLFLRDVHLGRISRGDACRRCPLSSRARGHCFDDASLFKEWLNSPVEYRAPLANKLHKILTDLYREEYER
jgi:hypothetical protein